MIMIQINQRASTLMEIMVILIALSAAVISMGVYVSRAYRGNVRRSTDAISATPYMPGGTSGSYTVEVVSTREEMPTTESGFLKDTFFTLIGSDTTTTIMRDERLNY